jgi:GT2 family glycosyltransferase
MGTHDRRAMKALPLQARLLSMFTPRNIDNMAMVLVILMTVFLFCNTTSFLPPKHADDRNAAGSSHVRTLVVTQPISASLDLPNVRCLNKTDTLPFRYFDGQRSFGVLEDTHFPVRLRRPLRIAFVTYATGPYMQFAHELWISIQRYAFVGHDVHYFIFGDVAQAWMRHPRVHLIRQSRVGWPFDSVGRHFLYLSQVHLFEDMDYILSIDSDTIVLEPLSIDMLGETFATMNAWFFYAPMSWWTYDARLTTMGREYSAAYIDPAQGQCYFGGGLFGGSYAGFVGILKSTTGMVTADLRKSPARMALWHDESYLNKHFFLHPPHVVLAPKFLYPEPPADKGLYRPEAWNEYNAHNPWLVNATASNPSGRLYEAGIYNLGVRKYLDNKLDEYQPAVASVPSVVSESQKEILLFSSKRDVEARVTFVTKAFERKACIDRLLQSIVDRYANASVVVVDDSTAPALTSEQLEAYAFKLPKLIYKRTNYDTGLAGCRNLALSFVKTEYFMLLDDDFVLSDESIFERLLDFLSFSKFDIAGGCIDSAHCYSLTKSPGALRVKSHVACKDNFGIEPMYDVPGLACWQTDMINNFFMGRTEKIRALGWDDQFKLGEHEDFFLRAKDAGVKVALCRGVSAINDNTCHPKDKAYLDKRMRVFEFWVPMFKKHGLQRMQTEAGNYTMNCDTTGRGNCSISIQQDFIWFG